MRRKPRCWRCGKRKLGHHGSECDTQEKIRRLMERIAELAPRINFNQAGCPYVVLRVTARREWLEAEDKSPSGALGNACLVAAGMRPSAGEEWNG